VRYATSILARALKRAVTWKLITHNPAVDIELPKYVKREMQSLTPEEAQKFLEACKGDKFGLMFELALITGLRPEEYLGLQWSDIDFQRKTVSVRRTLVWKRWTHKWYFGEPKSEKSRRTLPLPSYLMKELFEWKRAQNEHRLKFGETWQDYNLVFPSNTGTPLSIRNLERRHFKPLLVKANLPDIRLYDLRHSCATLLLADGENIKVVSERLGHADGALVLRTYAHVSPSMQRSATERMEKILRSS
jgi:integrase